CIAGTGSVAFGIDGRGGEARAGGWGPPFGDAGGAYWIGFQGVARALRLHDRGQRDVPLIERLLAVSGCPSLDRLVYGHLGAAAARPRGWPGALPERAARALGAQGGLRASGPRAPGGCAGCAGSS